jgi:hypothetical protein
MEEAPNREKVIYRLVEDCNEECEEPHHSGISQARSHSLPVGVTLSAWQPCVNDHGFETTVAQSRHIVVTAMLRYLLSQKFLVSASQSGKRTCVLNKEAGDMCLELEVIELEKTKCAVVVHDTEGTGAVAVEDLGRFLARRFV